MMGNLGVSDDNFGNNLLLPDMAYFPDGIDSQAEGDSVITHNKGREVEVISAIFSNTAANQVLGIALASCTMPVITYSNNNSFTANGQIPYAFELRYK